MKINIILFTLLCLTNLSIAFGQNERNIWYFGFNAGIDFNSPEPTVLTDGSLYGQEGCTSICDEFGNLLFYTNGENVWNRNHDIMPNGSVLIGHNSTAQSTITFKCPGHDDRYYIFLTSDQTNDTGLNFYLVDMTLDGGLGDVIVPDDNELLYPTCERLTYCKHSNGKDYWVVAHKLLSNQFHSFLVSSSGVSTTPVVSSIGISLSGPYNSKAVGCMKISTDGTKLASSVIYSDRVEVFDFNNSTGVISNVRVLTDFTLKCPYGIEFSPNSRFLYVSEAANVVAGEPNSKVYQYDTYAESSSEMQASRIPVIELSGPYGKNIGGSLQIAPNGKIYHAIIGRQHLGVIHKPNALGLLCEYEDYAFSLDTAFSSYGLPNYTNEFATVGIPKNEITDERLLVYPNPFQNSLQLSIPKASQNPLMVSICDNLGKIVFHEELKFENNTTQIELEEELPEGTYTITVSGESTFYVEKLIKVD